MAKDKNALYLDFFLDMMKTLAKSREDACEHGPEMVAMIDKSIQAAALHFSNNYPPKEEEVQSEK